MTTRWAPPAYRERATVYLLDPNKGSYPSRRGAEIGRLRFQLQKILRRLDARKASTERTRLNRSGARRED